MLGYVDYSIDVSFIKRLNYDFQDLCRETEEADKNDNMGVFLEDSNAISVGAKVLCMNGGISSQEWDLLERRYYNY